VSFSPPEIFRLFGWFSSASSKRARRWALACPLELGGERALKRKELMVSPYKQIDTKFSNVQRKLTFSIYIEKKILNSNVSIYVLYKNHAFSFFCCILPF
jgi:hypothetical protein